MSPLRIIYNKVLEQVTLYELNALIRDVLESNLDQDYWVQGELSDVRIDSRAGHMYAELIQKDSSNRAIIARARINCWARTFNLMHLRFQRETGSTIRSGMQVLLQVRVTFHEQYGYALNVQDIDSSYTMGAMARRRMEILRQLEEDGILNDNKELPLPRLLSRIAVISSESAAGYGDFCKQLENNDYGLAFHVTLYPSIMQGERVPEGIIQALESILVDADTGNEPDVVVIIRGGGATGDLSDFDSYELAVCIAQFPYPIITGIGHDRDETVLDHVAHHFVKTPTAAAAYLIDHQLQEATLVEDLQRRLIHCVQEKMLREKQRLEQHTAIFPLICKQALQRQDIAISRLWDRMLYAVKSHREKEEHRLDLLEQRMKSLDPDLLLKRGYSITLVNGLLVHDLNQLQPGDTLTTRLEKGEITSKVLLCKKK